MAARQRRPVWAVGEVSTAPNWQAGADVDVMLVGKRPAMTLDARRFDVPPGQRHFAAAFASSCRPRPGDYTVNVRARGRALDVGQDHGVASLCRSVPRRGLSTQLLVVRRGPTTGNRELPTADVRFRRSEQSASTCRPVDRAAQARLLGATASRWRCQWP